MGTKRIIEAKIECDDVVEVKNREVTYGKTAGPEARIAVSEALGRTIIGIAIGDGKKTPGRREKRVEKESVQEKTSGEKERSIEGRSEEGTPFRALQH